MFNIFLNDLFYFIKIANVHNYADDTTLSAFSNSIPNLLDLLEQDTELTLSWLRNNSMIANPEKFHSIILSKNRGVENKEYQVKIKDKVIKTESKVKLLGVTIDNKLNFDSHVSSLVKSASSQLNAICRLRYYLSDKSKNILVQSFVLSNFNYCPLIWHFSSAKSLHKIEMIQKRALRFLLNDNESSYEVLLSKSGRNSMNVYRLKTLCTEIFKTINNLSPLYMNDIFKLTINNRPTRKLNENYLIKLPFNTVKFGMKSLQASEFGIYYLATRNL